MTANYLNRDVCDDCTTREDKTKEDMICTKNVTWTRDTYSLFLPLTKHWTDERGYFFRSSRVANFVYSTSVLSLPDSPRLQIPRRSLDSTRQMLRVRFRPCSKKLSIPCGNFSFPAYVYFLNVECYWKFERCFFFFLLFLFFGNFKYHHPKKVSNGYTSNKRL